MDIILADFPFTGCMVDGLPCLEYPLSLLNGINIFRSDFFAAQVLFKPGKGILNSLQVSKDQLGVDRPDI